MTLRKQTTDEKIELLQSAIQNLIDAIGILNRQVRDLDKRVEQIEAER